jgi:hypothetical protein
MEIEMGNSTQKMAIVLNYINEYIKNAGYQPSYREIGAAVGFTSTSLVKYYIDKLIDAGMLERAPHVSRGFTRKGEKIIFQYMEKLPTGKTIRPNLAISVSALEYFDGCAYCGNKNEKVQADHFLPVCLGGSDEPHNIIPACRSCNASKGGKEPVEWVLINYGANTLARIISYTQRTRK